MKMNLKKITKKIINDKNGKSRIKIFVALAALLLMAGIFVSANIVGTESSEEDTESPETLSEEDEPAAICGGPGPAGTCPYADNPDASPCDGDCSKTGGGCKAQCGGTCGVPSCGCGAA